MRKSLLILAALIAFGGISAQAQGPKNKLDKERKEKKEWRNPFFKNNAAKASDDYLLNVTPSDEEMSITFSKCDDVKSRPLVIKNTSDQTINGTLLFNSSADVELGDTVFEKHDDRTNKDITNYFKIGGYSYSANSGALVKTDLATGNQIVKWNEDDDYQGLAYDGKTFWTSCGNYIYALDANLNPTGKKIFVGYSSSVAYDGKNLVIFGKNSADLVKAFDTNGNLVADYGHFPFSAYAATFDANTGLFWICDEISLGVKLADGKVNIEQVFYYPGYIAGFDDDGLPYLTDYSENEGILFKTTKFSTQPKGLSISQNLISLKPGETVTVNITATLEHGPETEKLGCLNTNNLFSEEIYFMRNIIFNYDIEPEYAATTGLQFNAFAGYSSRKQTAWIKNTGCSPIIFDDVPNLASDFFFIDGLVEPKIFEGALLPGDSIGAIIGFYADEAGSHSEKLTIETVNTEPIEIALTATVTELAYTAPSTANATVDCSDGTATVTANINNNSGATMSIGALSASVKVNLITSGWGSEVYWDILDSEGTTVYAVSSNTYASSTTYNLDLTLPSGVYTLEMRDSYGDGWNGGRISIIVEGETVLNNVTLSNGSYETRPFVITGPAAFSLASGTSINNFKLPLELLKIGGTSEQPIRIEGISHAVGSISITTAAGQGELSVAESIDFGSWSIDPDNSFSNTTEELTITNTGCGPLNISSITIGDGDFLFWDEDLEMLTKTISDIEIAPRSVYERTVFFMPSAAGTRNSTLTIATATGNTTVQLTGEGTGLPVLDYDGEGLGFVKDTVSCGQGSVTLKGRITNSSKNGADLIVTKPIVASYIAGTTNYGDFTILPANIDGGGVMMPYYFSDNDYNIYMPLEEGEYTLSAYSMVAGDGKIVVKSGNKTLLSVNVADIDARCNPNFNFTITEADLVKETIAPGDTLDLEMTVSISASSIGETTYQYVLASNDPNLPVVSLDANVRVVKEPKPVFPEVIDFGEISVGTEAWQYVTYENEGCGNFDFENFWVTNTENPLTNDWSEVGFVPTAAGTFTNTLKVATYYYTAGTEPIKDTFEITLKGTAVSSPSIVLPVDPVEVTAPKGATKVTATVEVGNSSTTTALKLTDANAAIIKLFSGSGTYANRSSWELYKISEEEGVETIISKSSGYFTASNQYKEELVLLPAGNYQLHTYNSYTSKWNNGSITIVTVDGVKILDNAQNQSYNDEYDFYFSIEESNNDVTVSANGTANVVFDIPVEGLEPGTYEFFRTYNTNDAENPNVNIGVYVNIDEYYEYDFNKTEVEFTPVRIGNTSYSSVTMRNHGTVPVGFNDVDFKDGNYFTYEGVDNKNGVAPVADSMKFYIEFYSETPGEYRDTMYIYHGSEKTDSIALHAFATNTQVIAVSSPNRYAAAGDVVNINVTFDNQVIISGESDAMPQLKMNNDAFAVLDSTAFDTDRDDTYTFTFKYTVQSNDNIALFDYKEDTVYMKSKTVVDIDGNEFNKVKLPAVGTLASTFPITLDNKAPQLAGFDYALDGLALELTVSFNEEVVGLNKNSFTLTGAEITGFKTKDNKTFTAAVTAQPCTDIVITINVNLKDLAGNAKKINETINVPAIHNYTASVVAPTCTEAGYTLNVCSLCKHEEHTNEVAATGHTAGKPVKENETAEGYDEVVYCTVCGAEIDRKHVSTTAIADNAVNALIYTNDGAIVVETAEANGAEISVVDINGRLVAKSKATSTRTVIPMSVAGVYVVSVGETTEKVALQ